MTDALNELSFAWHSEDLFDIRTYARHLRESVLRMQMSQTDEKLIACALEPVRRGGGQFFLPDGLPRLLDAAKRFALKVQRAADRMPQSAHTVDTTAPTPHSIL